MRLHGFLGSCSALLLVIANGFFSPARSAEIPSQEVELRRALQSGGHITFTNDGIITLSEPLPIIADTIIDAGSFTVVFSGGGVTRVLEVSSGVTMTLINLTIADGRAANGGGIFNDGGAVFALGCTFASNVACGNDGVERGASGEDAAGGAIYSRGNLIVLNSIFQHNSALGGVGADGRPGTTTNISVGGGPGGSGGAACGGALFALHRAVVSNCVFNGNSVAGGAGGYGGTGGRNMSWGRGGTGGRGGSGGEASGGAAYISATAVFTTITCSSNNSTGGAGGAGGAGGTDRNAYYGSHGGDSGSAGPGGTANGAAIAIAGGDVQVKGSRFLNNQLFGGKGGHGTTSPFMFEGLNGNGGPAGSAKGTALWVGSARTVIERCSFDGNVGSGGNGGAGANSHLYGVMFYPDDAGHGAGGGSALGTVFNLGNMTLAGCTFSSNVLYGGNGGAGGHGGRPNGGRRGSSGGSSGGGGHAMGGALYQLQDANVVNCTIVGNECHGGNGAPGGNAGIVAYPPNPLYGGDGGLGGDGKGGGVWTDSDASTSLESVTFVENSVHPGTGARGGYGYRVDPWKNPDGENGTNGVAGGTNIGGEGTTTIRNSILANATTNPQTLGSIADRGHNLCSDNSCGFGDNTSLNNVDPMLDPLADNGGPTLTMLPRGGSPAIDGASRNHSTITDQRGFARGRGSRPDIGATEAGGTAGATIRGRVTFAGYGVPGVTVKLGTHTAVTDAEGIYEFWGVEPGRYIVRPSERGLIFRPTMRQIQAAGDLSVDDFAMVQRNGR